MKGIILICCLLTTLDGLTQKKAVQTDQQLIAQLRADWTASLQNKQLQKAISLYTDDATFYSPGMKSVGGKKAISDLYQMVMKKYTSQCNLTSAGVEIAGPIAYDSGGYSETLVDLKTRKANRIQGDYLMTFKKQADGAWKITRIMWTEWK